MTYDISRGCESIYVLRIAQREQATLNPSSLLEIEKRLRIRIVFPFLDKHFTKHACVETQMARRDLQTIYYPQRQTLCYFIFHILHAICYTSSLNNTSYISFYYFLIILNVYTSNFKMVNVSLCPFI